MEKQFYFKKTHDVDKVEFARLLKLAKGGRTMRSFSEVCGVTQSTFTRIIQGANKGASSPELIEAIAKNAVPNSGVTIQALANANGYTIEENRPHVKERLDKYFHNLELHIRNILCQELIMREYKVRMENSSYKIGRGTRYKPDTIIATDAFSNESQEETTSWCIEYILYSKELPLDSNPDYGIDSYNYKVKSRALDLLSRAALISMIADNSHRSIRFSLIVIDKEAFDIIVRDFCDLVLGFDMTLILVDMGKDCIADEFMFRHKNIQDRYSLFMRTKFVCNDDPNLELDEERSYFEIDVEE